MGFALEKYWTKYANNYPKLAKCAFVLLKYPTSTTSVERAFADITAHFTKQNNRIHCETLQ